MSSESVATGDERPGSDSGGYKAIVAMGFFGVFFVVGVGTVIGGFGMLLGIRMNPLVAGLIALVMYVWLIYS